MEPSNKGQNGDSTIQNLAVLSFIKKLSSFRVSLCIRTIGKVLNILLLCTETEEGKFPHLQVVDPQSAGPPFADSQLAIRDH